MKKPLISVVMSAFNAEKFIATAIKSILNQTYTDFEFIIINDGSTDKTCEIIQSFADDRIVFIDKAKNAGLIAALNDGIKIAKGEYIARMDADDESLAQRFELQIEFMQNNPDIDVLGASVIFSCNNKSKIKKQPRTHAECLNLLIKGVCIWHPVAFIRKSALANIRYNLEFVAAEDYKLWVDLAKNGAKFANLQTPLLKYNLHSDNISIKKNSEQKKSTKMAQKAYLHYFLGNDFKKELDLLFDREKTATLKQLSEFYNDITVDKKPAMLRFLRKYIRDNIASIDYQFDRVQFILWLYYFRYKLKAFFLKTK